MIVNPFLTVAKNEQWYKAPTWKEAMAQLEGKNIKIVTRDIYKARQ